MSLPSFPLDLESHLDSKSWPQSLPDLAPVHCSPLFQYQPTCRGGCPLDRPKPADRKSQAFAGSSSRGGQTTAERTGQARAVVASNPGRLRRGKSRKTPLKKDGDGATARGSHAKEGGSHFWAEGAAGMEPLTGHCGESLK